VRWRRGGRALLLGELRRHILADGGHDERSPLYHGIVLEDILDCLALARAAGPAVALPEAEVAELTAVARRMADWLEAMLHPDGGLPLFNDCVVAGELPPLALLAYAGRLLPPGGFRPGPALALAASGYYVLRSGSGRMVIDCGAIGPDEFPAHAHADTLSYEWVWGADRVVVDSGTAEYALDDLRRYVRATAAHNTVVVDGVEQSEVWASHRVGRRARPLGARLRAETGAVVFAGAHDGYARLDVLHHRHVVALSDAWVVVDELAGRGRHRFESFVHLHPAFRIERDGRGGWLAASADRCVRVTSLGDVASEAVTGWYCPDWGQALPAPVLRFAGEQTLPARFGYVLAPAALEAELVLSGDGVGITLTGRIGDRSVRVHSARCTSSS
jgi:uncharacterized heparinase superfamily protein